MWCRIVGKCDIGQVFVPVISSWRLTDLRQRVENCPVQIFCLSITAQVELRSVNSVHSKRLRQSYRQLRSELRTSVSEDMMWETHSKHVGNEQFQYRFRFLVRHRF